MSDQTEVQIIPKPWGKEIWFANQPEFVGKILHINKGHRYSLQYHEKKIETQYVLKGRVKFTLDDKEVILEPGDKLDVHPGVVHRAEALEDVEIVEVSTNDLDDVVKIEDDYGRSGKGNDLENDRQLSENSGN